MTVEELEKIRKKARNAGFILAFALCCFFLCIVSLSISIPGITGGVGILLLVLALLGAVVGVAFNTKYSRSFEENYKKIFVLKALQSIIEDLDYKPNGGLGSSIVYDTYMIDMGDRYFSNDYISGKYKNTNFKQADILIQEVTEDSDGNTTTSTIFKGRWMVFDFNKKFKAKVQVRQKGFSHASVNNIFRSHSVRELSMESKYQKVELEDSEFNRLFKTFSQDPHNAFYVLTPALMEKMKNVVSNIKGKVMFGFVDNKLHVAIRNNKDSFEHSVYRKIDEAKDTEEVLKDIKLITDFVDELDLDNKLFMD